MPAPSCIGISPRRGMSYFDQQPLFGQISYDKVTSPPHQDRCFPSAV